MNRDLSNLKISDMALASFLHAIGAQLVSVDRSNPTRCVFCFKLSPEQEGALAKWQRGTALVNALALWNSIQVLKRRVYENGYDKAPVSFAR